MSLTSSLGSTSSSSSTGGLSSSTLGTGSNGSAISFGGLASGLNTQAIIQALTAGDQTAISNLTNQQQQLEGQETIYGQLSSAIAAFGTAASALSLPSAFQTFAATSSETGVATVSLSGTQATAGVYNLTVNSLAQAHKIASAAQTDVTSGLGQTGTFIVNGQAVNVTASDSLTSIAQKINGLNAGVTASLINGGSGNGYLTLTSSSTGISGQIQLADVSGSVLGNLGILSGSSTVRSAITNGAQSTGFASETSPIGTQLNATIPSGTVQINGTSVAINPATDSLQQIAININAANAGVTATVVPTTNSSTNTTTYALQIVGTSGTPTFTDSQNILSSMGILQQGYANQLVKAQDASYNLDGINLTSSSNTITSAIPGVSLTLNQATTTTNGTTTPATSTISVSSDTTTISSKVSAFATAYNAVADMIAGDSTVDPTTYASGPLFGDPVAQAVSNQLTGSLFQNVPGLTGSYTNLASIGFSLDQNGDLQVNSSTLSTALSSDPSAVAALFNSVGNSANPNLSYVTSGTQTKASGAAGYDVNITQAATKGSYTGEVAQTQASTSPETLTFSGALFSNTPYQLTVPTGSQASDVVHLINTDANLSGVLTASLDSNGKLVLSSKQYGTNGNFTAVSNETAAANNSGLGVGSLGTSVTGVDVAGTIDGEAATGSGQFLTGNTGNTNTDGLQIQYTGTTTGDQGTLTFTQGLGQIFNSLSTQFTDPTNGLIATSNASLQDQYNFLQTEVTNQTTEMNTQITNLQNQYATMETTIAGYQSQGQRLTAMGW